VGHVARKTSANTLTIQMWFAEQVLDEGVARMTRDTIAIVSTAFLIGVAPIALDAQDAPQFMTDTMPQESVGPAWDEFQSVMADGDLDAVSKELIGLGVAAQIPCDYCVYYHTQAARQHGATDEQIREALASAALVRKWSTMLQGSQYDEEEWRQQVDAMFAGQ
jgi:AhpD family alkylhydroperoxidase